MALMLDPCCVYDTFADTLAVGRACDEAGFYWYEDPMRDGGVSLHAHRKLRSMIKTPLLQGEHVHLVEAHADMAAADATDFWRADPEYDGGITGVMKIAHAAEGYGMDVELHIAGPAQRHCMAAMRNSNFYEMGSGTSQADQHCLSTGLCVRLRGRTRDHRCRRLCLCCPRDLDSV